MIGEYNCLVKHGLELSAKLSLKYVLKWTIISCDYIYSVKLYHFEGLNQIHN
jgi:hypothetical protein